MLTSSTPIAQRRVARASTCQGEGADLRRWCRGSEDHQRYHPTGPIGAHLGPRPIAAAKLRNLGWVPTARMIHQFVGSGQGSLPERLPGMSGLLGLLEPSRPTFNKPLVRFS